MFNGKDDKDLARRMVELYFTLFKRYVGDKENTLVTRLLSALLTGVNRAFPYADISSDAFNEHIDTLFRVVHSGTLSTSVQAPGSCDASISPPPSPSPVAAPPLRLPPLMCLLAVAPVLRPRP